MKNFKGLYTPFLGKVNLRIIKSSTCSLWHLDVKVEEQRMTHLKLEVQIFESPCKERGVSKKMGSLFAESKKYFCISPLSHVNVISCLSD